MVISSIISVGEEAQNIAEKSVEYNFFRNKYRMSDTSTKSIVTEAVYPPHVWNIYLISATRLARTFRKLCAETDCRGLRA